jgi:hypothetical protein
MLEPPKRNLLEKFEQVEYTEISINKDNIVPDKSIEVRYAKSYSVQATILFVVLNIMVIYSYLKSSNFIHQNPISSFLFLAFSFGGLVTFLIQYFKNKVILRLTIEAFEYKDTKILWKDIRNMYLKKQSVEHGFNHDIVIEVQKGKPKYFSLDLLDRDYKTVISDIENFYGNYVKTNSNQNAI